MYRFYFSKSTQSSYVWSYKENGEACDLYIKKWRVPDEVPKSIDVNINFSGKFEIEPEITERMVKVNPALKYQPIVRKAHYKDYHTKTVRFETMGSDRPLPSIYLPHSFLQGKEEEKTLQVIIDWQRPA